MSTTCADERYTIPGRGFRNTYANSPRAPRQVIGFDLPATAGKSGLALDSDDDSANFNCLHPYSLSSQKTSIPKGNSPAATSPRSALQQLLLPTAAGSEPACPLAAGNSLSISQALSIVEPASSKAPTAKQPAAAVELTSTSKACTVVGRVPVPAPAFNWPASKGIAQLVNRPSLHSASIRDRHGDCPPVVTVGELKSVSRTGMRSCQSPEVTALHAWSGSSKRQVSTKTTLDAKDTLPEERKKSYWTEKAAMKMERPRGTVGIDRKQVTIHISDKSKKSSLFLLSSNSPVAEYGNELGADQCKFLSMDMEFLNSCHLCKRGLGQGHDVFMYRGDKAFCSMECRCQQILMDDRKERRTPPVIRAGSSPAYRSNMASTSRHAGMNEAGVTTPPTHHSISIDRHDFMSSAAAA